MAGLALSNVTKSFGETPVLNSIDLSVNDGEFLTLVGPSGCGKSTLLRIIAGLESMDSGSLAIDDHDVSQVRAADRNLAMVFQSYALYPHLTVAENMMTPLKLRDLNWSERFPILGPMLARGKYRALMDQVRDTADILKITPLLDRKPGQMSGGQRQRAALGRAMVRNPVAFLMDEPLSNLDAALRVHMRSELADLHRSLGTTFIYVTHDQAEALTMSDRMAVMMHGDILQLDTPHEIYTNPQHVDVASFVGSPKINLLPVDQDKDGQFGVLGITIAEADVPVVQIGIRCEHLTVTEAVTAHAWEAHVVHLENLGSDLFVHCVIADSDTRVIARTSPANRHFMGQTVYLKPDPEAVLAFDKDGERVPLKAIVQSEAKKASRKRAVA
ncbi:MAG: ABC transporter ATP-binding protein [Pseudomonadota bacterium]